MNKTNATTIVELLNERAASKADERLYTFLVDGEREEVQLTYRQLDEQARTIAAHLQKIVDTSRQAASVRALLLYPPGLDYITAFFGCMYAGVVAVPVYPPDPATPARSLPRLQAIAQDAQPTLALTTSPILAMAEGLLAQSSNFPQLQWLATDTDVVDKERWQAPDLDSKSVALLQYTSGSTAVPRGVLLTHHNLLHNSALIHDYFGHTPDSQGVIWLPPYHDMGLIGGILQPLYGGFPVTLMSPLDFLKRPLRWLQAISRYGATTSGGPNFAYELCIRKTTPEQRSTLDLSTWQVAFNGAEPIRADTLDQFVATFAPYGFRPEAFYPCYGLAEATLIVSGGDKATQPRRQAFQKEALTQNQALKATEEDHNTQTLISCGKAPADQQFLIVQPETLTPCLPGRVGEIWVSGPSIAQGYWGQEEATRKKFQAHLVDTGEGPFLRTGDLGFMQEGELFITGRLKDLIIIRGQNHYPQEIERTVEQCHPALRPGCNAAFSIDVNGTERLVVVQEVDARHTGESATMIDTIRQVVSAQHNLQLYAVALIQARTIPKTSSGKIQRYACRQAYLDQTLYLIDQSVLTQPSDEIISGESFIRQAVTSIADADARQSLLTIYLQEQAGRILGTPADQLTPQQSLSSLGIDSLTAVEFKNEIETSLDVAVPLASLLEGVTLAELVTAISAGLDEETLAKRSGPPPATTAPPAIGPASPGQQALWFLHQLAPDTAAYNIIGAARIHTPLDSQKLKRALETLVQRHPALRTTFTTENGQLLQQLAPTTSLDFALIDARTWSPTQRDERLADEAHQPFNLSGDNLFRLRVYELQDGTHILLLVIHHLIADFWSLAVLVHELGVLYTNPQVSLPPLTHHYIEFVQWQTAQLNGPHGEQLRAYWQQQLGGDLPTLNLPTDRPRPPVQTFTGCIESIQLGHDLTARCHQLGRRHDATLYMTLLAAFQVLLHRYSGQKDILVGSPANGRVRAELSSLVGYFVNPVVMRAHFEGTTSFAGHLRQVRQTVLDAFKHQDYPFALLAERLQPHRDPSRSPIFQAMFMYQQAPRLGTADLSAFALHEPGSTVTIGDLTIEPVDLAPRTAQFDITLLMAETPQGLRATFQYNSDLFNAATIRRLLDSFRILLTAITEDPQTPVARLPLLSTAVHQQIVDTWNAIRLSRPPDQDIHDLFAAQVGQTPEAIALVFGDHSISYAGLNQKANQLAHYLQSLGVGPGVSVAVCLSRSVEMMVSLLAILKTGGAYVPLDPTYPPEHLAFMIRDAQVPILLTNGAFDQALTDPQPEIVHLNTVWPGLTTYPTHNPSGPAQPEQPAYIIYTSGSTGRPKGTIISHRSVVNFFLGMDERIGCDKTDTMLAVTSISFDISILELFWPLTRGAKVVLLSEEAVSGRTSADPSISAKPIDFSLFYFAADESEAERDKYRLLIEGAKFADEQGFAAVWTPERHFHAFGGLYPNPAVTGAALATITQNIQIRAGSVVIPLHHAIRVAEDWSVVDNLSHGRVGIAFASGWHANDFVFFPENYEARKEVTQRGLEMVRRLWRGQPVSVINGTGHSIEVRILPRPIQRELPIWVTAAGNPQTFVMAGRIGGHILTHLLGQSLDEVAEKIALYRRSRAENGFDPDSGHVVLMLHTFIGDDAAAIKDIVRTPFTNYLRTSAGLMAQLARSFNMPFDMDKMSDEDINTLLAFAFDRYYDTGALFGTAESALYMVEQVKRIGVNEIACLIDFGLPTDDVLANLPHLHRLKEVSNGRHQTNDHSLLTQARRYKPTLLQCTPSLLRLILLDPDTTPTLQSLRTLMLGGEALSPDLAQQVQEALPARLNNMYGPTETTIWSTTDEVKEINAAVPIGRPIANTQIYILDQHYEPVPIGVPGELYIGGDGLAHGYLNLAGLTAARFIPNPFHPPAGVTQGGTRLYKTGDLARYRPDGRIEFLGRTDFQIKLRGFRIELGEIEAVLVEHTAVRQVVVVARQDAPADMRLVAYFVPLTSENGPSPSDLRSYLKAKLPNYMVPATFVKLDHFPLTANGKVNRQALPAAKSQPTATNYVAPRSQIEQVIAEVWQQALRTEQVSIHDNFFDIGGHSLLLAQVHSQLRERFARQIPLVKMLEHPTISALARFLAAEEDEHTTIVQSQARAQKQRASRRRRARQQRA